MYFILEAHLYTHPYLYISFLVSQYFYSSPIRINVVLDTVYIEVRSNIASLFMEPVLMGKANMSKQSECWHGVYNKRESLITDNIPQKRYHKT